MERALWLKEKRRLAEERMDTLFAPIYDEQWGAYINPAHERFMQRFLILLPQYSTILDAACGTGKYWSMLLERGHTIIGIDQAQGMLSRAKAKFPSVHIEKIGLQEIQYQETFDGIVCMDAMENVFPEDWLLVLNNFHQALKAQGYLYFTVELADEKEIENAYLAGKQLGLPVVYGEWAHESGYHYYPLIEQVKKWIQQARFILVEEGEGDGYYHFVVRKES
jgi:2-polyprenyl-3-methyl-5-hydroxy-6-metoxy-1,4-benzoquinol methylase